MSWLKLNCCDRCGREARSVITVSKSGRVIIHDVVLRPAWDKQEWHPSVCQYCRGVLNRK